MITIFELVAIIVAAAVSLIEISFNQYHSYKKAPVERKRQLRADMHNDLEKGIQVAKSIATETVINAAMDEHANTGLSKKNKAVEVISTALSNAGFKCVPTKIIEVIVESAYQTSREFIQKYNLDSRLANTPDPVKLSGQQVLNALDGKSNK